MGPRSPAGDLRGHTLKRRGGRGRLYTDGLAPRSQLQSYFTPPVFAVSGVFRDRGGGGWRRVNGEEVTARRYSEVCVLKREANSDAPQTRPL